MHTNWTAHSLFHSQISMIHCGLWIITTPDEGFRREFGCDLLFSPCTSSPCCVCTEKDINSRRKSDHNQSSYYTAQLGELTFRFWEWKCYLSITLHTERDKAILDEPIKLKMQSNFLGQGMYLFFFLQLEKSPSSGGKENVPFLASPIVTVLQNESLFKSLHNFRVNIFNQMFPQQFLVSLLQVHHHHHHLLLALHHVSSSLTQLWALLPFPLLFPLVFLQPVLPYLPQL